jgi:hypothetical protein
MTSARQKDNEIHEIKLKVDSCAADLFLTFNKHISENNTTPDEFMLSLTSVLFAMMQSKKVVDGIPIPLQIQRFTEFLQHLYRDNKELTDDIYRGLETVEK